MPVSGGPGTPGGPLDRPGSWRTRRATARRAVLLPVQRFLQTEHAGGILLLGAAAAVLVWAEDPLVGSYERVWETPLAIGGVQEDLRHWVSEGLMTVFFLVVGLEIKREIVTGELRDLRGASLPVVAAIGGMVAPALLYLLFNPRGDAARGWGIPMATDIAFAVGALQLVGSRLPSGWKPFLLALAIVDDIGAIVVIALFYSGGASLVPLGVAVGLLLLIVLAQRLGVASIAPYALLGVAVWLATREAGIHPTIAGVALGLLAPTRPIRRQTHWARPEPDVEVSSPQQRLEDALHPWSSKLVVPLFALASAGVDLSGAASLGRGVPVAIGVVAGLVVGKLAGISLASWAALRVGFARLPEGGRVSEVVGVAALAGIGFTVSLFIADLAFSDPARLHAAKVGILVGSLLAGAVGVVSVKVLTRRRATRP
jgi:Na+:H+ antiporter, NhaA family